MQRVRQRVNDRRVLQLIQKYLKVGVMIDGLHRVQQQGTPRGGPLSPLLSNILLTDLDRELERVVVNLVEELLQVQIHHPLMTRQDMRLSRQDGLMGAASRTEPIASSCPFNANGGIWPPLT